MFPPYQVYSAALSYAPLHSLISQKYIFLPIRPHVPKAPWKRILLYDDKGICV